MGQLLFTVSVIVLKFIITHSEVLSFVTCRQSHKWRDGHGKQFKSYGMLCHISQQIFTDVPKDCSAITFRVKRSKHHSSLNFMVCIPVH